MDIEQAVTSPRLHYEEEVLYVEGGYRRDEMETLRARFPQQRFWEELNIFFGGAHSLMRTGGGAISGIGDPRRGGECRILG